MKKNSEDNLISPLSRVDGRDKVMGAAKYSAEYKIDGLTYGVIVGSTIAKGSINNLDTKKAEIADGVLTVLSYKNLPKIPGYEGDTELGPAGLKVFNNNKIFFDGQPIAIVVADTYERAIFASTLIKATYFKDSPDTNLNANLSKAVTPKNRKDYSRGLEDAYKTAPLKVEEEYVMPINVHNPMELGSITAVWYGDDKLTVYDKTQGVKGAQRTYAKLFNLKPENVRVISTFVGGAFGMALRTWPYQAVTIMASKIVGKPVKLMLARNQMFTQVGYRPYTLQKIGIGATQEGKLVGITHHATGITSTYEQFTEGTVNASRFMYNCENVNTIYKLIPINIGTPTPMRGPGEATGTFALESAMDELSYKLKMDPLEFRILNYAEKDPETNKPWSSNYLKECYSKGAEKIGWKNRDQQPGAKMENGEHVGYGVSCGTFGAYRNTASARMILTNDEKLIIQSATSDIGPGTGTAMVTIASSMLGIDPANIKFQLGDSILPNAPTQGGSTTVSAVGSAVHDVCIAMQNKLLELAKSLPASEFKNVPSEKIVWSNARISNGNISLNYTDILKQNNLPNIDLTVESKGTEEMQKYSMYSFTVHFVKLYVHPATGMVRLKHVVSVVDSGKIISPKTAESQMLGGVVGGIGMALTEEGIIDYRTGRYVNNNLADYHVPVNNDVPDIDVIFIDKPDPITNPMGTKGMGEVSLIGFAAAVSNAVYNATGKRIRELPITPDKLI